MKPFDPLSYENLGKSIVNALQETRRIPLEDLKTFDGVGIYALFYTGTFEAYQPLVNSLLTGREVAIYVGKAEADKTRKSTSIFDPNIEFGPKLYKRVMDHKKSIEQAVNLQVEDFEVKTLCIAPTWIPLAEQIALRELRPLWNAVVDGFGNHNPGKGRINGARSKWDVVHPGRAWAENFPLKHDRESIINNITSHLIEESMPHEK